MITKQHAQKLAVLMFVQDQITATELQNALKQAEMLKEHARQKVGN